MKVWELMAALAAHRADTGVRIRYPGGLTDSVHEVRQETIDGTSVVVLAQDQSRSPDRQKSGDA